MHGNQSVSGLRMTFFHTYVQPHKGPTACKNGKKNKEWGKSHIPAFKQLFKIFQIWSFDTFFTPTGCETVSLLWIQIWTFCCSELIVAQEFLSQSLAKSGLAFHSFRRIKNMRHFWKSTNKHLISFFEVCKSNYFCPRETLFFFFILHFTSTCLFTWTRHSMNKERH